MSGWGCRSTAEAIPSRYGVHSTPLRRGHWPDAVGVGGGVGAGRGLVDGVQHQRSAAGERLGPAALIVDDGGEPPITSTSASPTTSTAVPAVALIDHIQWGSTDKGRQLRVYPTAAGRKDRSIADANRGWTEVLAAAPDADTPGMPDQFHCHGCSPASSTQQNELGP